MGGCVAAQRPPPSPTPQALPCVSQAEGRGLKSLVLGCWSPALCAAGRTDGSFPAQHAAKVPRRAIQVSEPGGPRLHARIRTCMPLPPRSSGAIIQGACVFNRTTRRNCCIGMRLPPGLCRACRVSVVGFGMWWLRVCRRSKRRALEAAEHMRCCDMLGRQHAVPCRSPRARAVCVGRPPLPAPAQPQPLLFLALPCCPPSPPRPGTCWRPATWCWETSCRCSTRCRLVGGWTGWWEGATGAWRGSNLGPLGCCREDEFTQSFISPPSIHQPSFLDLRHLGGSHRLEWQAGPCRVLPR